MTKGVEDGKGDEQRCECGHERYRHTFYALNCGGCDCRRYTQTAAVPVATPAMKDEVATTEGDAYLYKCGGGGLAGIKPCGWEAKVPVKPSGDFSNDFNGTCPSCRQSIYIAAVITQTLAMKDEVESATTTVMNMKKQEIGGWKPCATGDTTRWTSATSAKDAENAEIATAANSMKNPTMNSGEMGTEPSPTLKDEVYAMLAELPGQLCGETVRILMPHLEDAVKWRKR